VSRQFPLTSIHDNAQKSAEAAFCAGYQNKYWEMDEELFATQGAWGGLEDALPTFKQYAADLGLDTTSFNQCLDNGEASVDVASDAMAAQTFNVTSTPTFFVNDVQIPALSVAGMLQVIDYVASAGSLPEILPQDGDFHVAGNLQTAQAAMAVFLDYASTDAAKYATEVFPQIQAQYVDAGSLIYVFHPWAGELGSLSTQAAIAAECAGEQSKFWEMQAKLFSDQPAWTASKTPRDSFTGYAEGLQLDKAKFETCLDGDSAALRARAGAIVAMQYGVAAAQTYLFGDGNSLNGAPTFDQVKTILDGMINP
jgi:protein-disulfide isomerase